MITYMTIFALLYAIYMASRTLVKIPDFIIRDGKKDGDGFAFAVAAITLVLVILSAISGIVGAF